MHMRCAPQKKKEAMHHSLSLTILLSQKSKVANLCMRWSKKSLTIYLLPEHIVKKNGMKLPCILLRGVRVECKV